MGDFSGCLVVRTLCLYCKGMDSIPGWETKRKKKKGTQIGSHRGSALTLRCSSSSKPMSLTPEEQGHPRRSRVPVLTRVQGNDTPFCSLKDPAVMRRALWAPEEETCGHIWACFPTLLPPCGATTSPLATGSWLLSCR